LLAEGKLLEAALLAAKQQHVRVLSPGFDKIAAGAQGVVTVHVDRSTAGKLEACAAAADSHLLQEQQQEEQQQEGWQVRGI
jgi:hypothetical protein